MGEASSPFTAPQLSINLLRSTTHLSKSPMYEFQDSDCYLPGRSILLQNKASTQRVHTLVPMVYYRDVPVPFSPTDHEALRQMRISSGFYVDHIPLWAQQIVASKRR